MHLCQGTRVRLVQHHICTESTELEQLKSMQVIPLYIMTQNNISCPLKKKNINI